MELDRSSLLVELARLDEEYKSGKLSLLFEEDNVGYDSIAQRRSTYRRQVSSPKGSPASPSFQDDFDKLMEKLRSNRASRQALGIGAAGGKSPKKKRGRKKKPAATCPMCHETLYGDLQDINMHVDSCLKHHGNKEAIASSEPQSANASSINEYEMDSQESSGDGLEYYRVGNQTRIRTCSALQSGYSEMGFQTSKRSKTEDEEEDLEIDNEDTNHYGPAQYDEGDLIRHEDSANEDEPSSKYVPQDFSTSTEKHPKEIQIGSQTETILISALKEKIQEQAKMLTNQVKCRICMDPYASPAVSVVCWHVHCEKCWLEALGAKKLCPQCMVITTPADLRRVYL
eukprot:TRINITY_DN8261_c0_g1_i1.p1 TRINITY_DN8261_c0_g1~~TRINITY_DN8261_c0_g1_i1.p1  ORF type:complete len:342 (+),score=72.25 TRINITY_DN8261_c0_g1_i1:71-1096(+)